MPNRTERRRQLGLLRKLERRGAVRTTVVDSSQSGTSINLSFSSALFDRISVGVTAALFGVSESDVTGLNERVNASNRGYNALHSGLDSLFLFNSPDDYLTSLSRASGAVNEFVKATCDYMGNPFVERLKRRHVPPKERIREEFRRQTIKKLGLLKYATTPDNFDSAVTNYPAAIDHARSIVEKNGPVFIARVRLGESLERILSEVERVSEEGSQKAAHLFFTRLVRILVPETSEQKVQMLLQKPVYQLNHMLRFKDNLPLRLLRLASQTDFGASYADIGKRGLEDLLAALDREESRTRHCRRLNAAVYFIYSFHATPAEVCDFAVKLEKIGVSASSAAELLQEVPIGQRKYNFDRWSKEPSIVKLYESLKPYGIDARTYSGFMTDLANVEVAVEGKRLALKRVIEHIAMEEHCAAGAAWLLRHPDIWATEDSGRFLALARKVEPSLSGEGLRELAKNLSRIDSGSLASLQSITLENVMAPRKETEKPEPALFPKPAGESTGARDALPAPVFHRTLWANISYHRNPELVGLILAAYQAVPIHLQHRIKQVDNYVREHYRFDAREDILRLYFATLSKISPLVVNHVFANEQFFQATLERLLEKGFVQNLESAVVKSTNPHATLYKLLVHEPRVRGINEIVVSSIGRAVTEDKNGGPRALQPPYAPALDGVVCKVAILGNFEGKSELMRAVTARLADYSIEPVFVSSRRNGRPPDCDCVIVYTSNHTPHSAATRGFYEQHNFPVRVITGGFGVGPIIQAAINFRNELVLGSNGRASA
ncbi:hypothetical protein HYU13_02375 [Candidatus Woesearchaeota archaeon]|nr:hypothetical protein [Candidatus Woesearchaeota archaeon]